jgi:hypothetical protein
MVKREGVLQCLIRLSNSSSPIHVITLRRESLELCPSSLSMASLDDTGIFPRLARLGLGFEVFAELSQTGIDFPASFPLAATPGHLVMYPSHSTPRR